MAEVRLQLHAADHLLSTEWQQWLTWGGMEFLMRSTRMNGLLFALPDAVLAAFLILAIAGGIWSQMAGSAPQQRGRLSLQLAVGSAGCYSCLFSCFGRPENLYWGLVAAPCLLWSFAAAIDALFDVLANADEREWLGWRDLNPTVASDARLEVARALMWRGFRRLTLHSTPESSRQSQKLLGAGEPSYKSRSFKGVRRDVAGVCAFLSCWHVSDRNRSRCGSKAIKEKTEINAIRPAPMDGCSRRTAWLTSERSLEAEILPRISQP